MQISPSRLFALGLLGLLVASTLGTACVYWHIYGADKLFGDFKILYAAADNIVGNRLSAVYDVGGVSSLFAEGKLKDFAYYLNPPTGLFLLYPFGLLGPLSALALWSTVQLALLFVVLRTDYMQRLFSSLLPQTVNSLALLIVTFLAFSLHNFLFGQVAVFCAVLFLLALAWRKSRPALAGVMLGLFSLKPQLGMLIPVLLIAERNWKPLLWAVLVTAGLALLSVGIWGEGLWQDYAEMLTLRSQFMIQNPNLLFAISTSVYAAIRTLGASATIGLACQGILCIALIIYIWPVLKQGEEWQKLMVVTLATYLVTPYALIYDIPLLAVPCAFLLRRAEADRARFSELIALLLLILLPLVTILMQLEHIPYSVIAIGFALGVAMRLTARKQSLYE